MTTINTFGALIGIPVGVIFLLAGAVLLPLWQITEDNKRND
ncbi:hypothetical protein [Stackebrandtia nassauensis]|uniref:Uncharacterized protein n=1 Tax=Stackebrandtia nassauensis (strain DSM 44728 / CIP 108903 / NRRL B-16338 / NBRC 102104 / LLR-40K-21) TaxID=446470 RepID=D3PWV9_STANL|nr:hypothetical protein [Stackebrandtia nassauensis]ADD45183.1 hypothetical protein Snas_5552 [Stackebrandtia nassauensis DSM 44728]